METRCHQPSGKTEDDYFSDDSKVTGTSEDAKESKKTEDDYFTE